MPRNVQTPYENLLIGLIHCVEAGIVFVHEIFHLFLFHASNNYAINQRPNIFRKKNALCCVECAKQTKGKKKRSKNRHKLRGPLWTKRYMGLNISTRLWAPTELIRPDYVRIKATKAFPLTINNGTKYQLAKNGKQRNGKIWRCLPLINR